MPSDSLKAFLEHEPPSLRKRGYEYGRTFLQDRAVQTFVIGVLVVDALVIVDKTQIIHKTAEFLAQHMESMAHSWQNLSHGFKVK